MDVGREAAYCHGGGGFAHGHAPLQGQHHAHGLPLRRPAKQGHHFLPGVVVQGHFRAVHDQGGHVLRVIHLPDALLQVAQGPGVTAF